MGLSDQETNGSTTLLSGEAESFAGVVFAAVAADERITDEELKYLHIIFSRMRLFDAWAAVQYQPLFDKLNNILNNQGLDRLMEMSIESLPPKLYQTAFALSVDLVLADGIVTREEKDFLYDLQQKMGIETDLATKIIEVIIIKNRCQ